MLGFSTLCVSELGRVPCLAICSDPRFQEVFLFHCDDQWDVLPCPGYPTVTVGKAEAPPIYPGLAPSWIGSHVTDQEAGSFLDDLWGGGCTVCEKPRGIRAEHGLTKTHFRFLSTGAGGSGGISVSAGGLNSSTWK